MPREGSKPGEPVLSPQLLRERAATARRLANGWINGTDQKRLREVAAELEEEAAELEQNGGLELRW